MNLAGTLSFGLGIVLNGHLRTLNALGKVSSDSGK